MQALVKQVLAAWREAERVASQSKQGSAQHAVAVAAVERLRALYSELSNTVATEELTAYGAPFAEPAAE